LHSPRQSVHEDKAIGCDQVNLLRLISQKVSKEIVGERLTQRVFDHFGDLARRESNSEMLPEAGLRHIKPSQHICVVRLCPKSKPRHRAVIHDPFHHLVPGERRRSAFDLHLPLGMPLGRSLRQPARVTGISRIGLARIFHQ
jgi:hypothetical protein